MSYVQLHLIFPIYEEKFYKLLVPYIIDELKKTNIIAKSGKTMPADVYIRYVGAIYKTTSHQTIFDIAKKLFDYLFPEVIYKALEPPRKNADRSNTLAKNPLISNRRHIIGHTLYLKLLNDINNEVLNIILKKLDINKLYPNYRKEIDSLRENILNRPIIEVVNTKLENKTRTLYDDFKEAVSNFGYDKLKREDIIDKQYYQYQKSFERRLLTLKAKKNLSNNIKTFILKLINENADEVPKTQIDKLTFKIRRGNDTLNNVYDYYLEQRRIKLASHQIKISPLDSNMNIDEFNKIIGYKGLNKRKTLIKSNYGNIQTIKLTNDAMTSINSFPLKENKQYFLHTIAPEYSYIMDLMFENKEFCYLVLININTRKLWVEETSFNIPLKEDETDEQFTKRAKELIKNNKKSTENIKQALENILTRMNKENTTIKHLRSDGESAFKSELMKNTFYKDNDIDFHEVRREPTTKYPEFMYGNHMVKTIRNEKKNEWKTEPKHSSLALIDRAIRTIRDIAFNMRAPIINPDVMKIIVWQYNNAPHSTLSKYAGQPVSPNEVDQNKDLEKFIVKRIQQDNFNIMMSKGFDLNEGTKVKVFNEKNRMMKRRSNIEPGKFEVIRRKGPLFELIDENTGKTQIKSRYQISPLFD